MTRKSTVFISSTCYDLRSVRNRLKNMIEEEIGMEAKLSEHANFPVDSSIGTVENCLKVVEKNADIFVLIIGSRYGYITDKGKSVTNLEYLRAKEMNIPIYIFIDSQTLNKYSEWKNNNDIVFPDIDNNKLFNFIEKVREEDNAWTHEYEIDSQILEMLKLQINYLFTDSLDARNQLKSSNFSDKVLNTSSQALRLALEQPMGWEYKFFFQILKDEIKKHDVVKKDFEYEIIIDQGLMIESVEELSGLVSSRLKRFELLINGLSNLINKALNKAFGEPNEPSDLDFLIYVAERFSMIYSEIIKWKLGLRNVYCPEWGEKLLDTLHVISDRPIADIDNYVENCIEELNNLPIEIPEGNTVELKLNLNLSDFDIKPLQRELKNITESLRRGEIV